MAKKSKKAKPAKKRGLYGNRTQRSLSELTLSSPEDITADLYYEVTLQRTWQTKIREYTCYVTPEMIPYLDDFVCEQNTHYQKGNLEVTKFIQFQKIHGRIETTHLRPYGPKFGLMAIQNRRRKRKQPKNQPTKKQQPTKNQQLLNLEEEASF